jgi:hypothetical protein
MSKVWGREETYRWPSGKPVWTIMAVALAVVAAVERRRVLKYGRRTKGPEFATAAQFNRSQQSDGIGFITKEPRTWVNSCCSVTGTWCGFRASGRVRIS